MQEPDQTARNRRELLSPYRVRGFGRLGRTCFDLGRLEPEQPSAGCGKIFSQGRRASVLVVPGVLVEVWIERRESEENCIPDVLVGLPLERVVKTRDRA